MRLLGHEIGRTTVQRILAEDGIEPAPERRKHLPWATFLKAHWGAIAAMDFFKVEVLSLRGPVRYAVLVVMDLQSRRVQIAGIVQEPYEDWMFQVLRNLIDGVDGFLLPHHYLIMDRDPVFTQEFRARLACAGIEPIRLPRRSPNWLSTVEFQAAFSEDLRGAKTRVDAAIGAAIVRTALDGDGAQQRFYARSRMGWNDRHIPDAPPVGTWSSPIPWTTT